MKKKLLYLIGFSILIQQNSIITMLPSYGLILAVSRGDLEQTKKCLKYGANINTVSKDGWTPLMIAAQAGHMEIVKFLLKVPGIDINYTDNYHFSAYSLAIFSDNFTIADLLKPNQN